MRASEVKTYNEIVEYIEYNVCDETSEAICGLDVFNNYLADVTQKLIIEKWVLDIWEDIKDDIIYEEEADRHTFADIPLLGRFTYENNIMVKIICEDTGTEMGMNYMGQRTMIDPSEIVEYA